MLFFLKLTLKKVKEHVYLTYSAFKKISFSLYFEIPSFLPQMWDIGRHFREILPLSLLGNSLIGAAGGAGPHPSTPRVKLSTDD